MGGSENSRKTFVNDLEYWAIEQPDAPWLVEHWSSTETTFSWAQGAQEIRLAAAGISAALGQSRGQESRDTGSKLRPLVIGRYCGHVFRQRGGAALYHNER